MLNYNTNERINYNHNDDVSKLSELLAQCRFTPELQQAIALQKTQFKNGTLSAEEYLQTRFDEFRNKTLPVIDFYKRRGLLVEIDGTLSLDEVTKEILKKLSEFPKRKN